jgi:hypothetical protein
MKIGGHGLREHIRLLLPLFGLIAAVWLLRLIMDLAGTPPALVRIVSVTVAGSASILLAVLLIHFKRFGGYPNIVAATFLLEFWSQLLICSAIAFSALTGTTNVYSAPEYSHTTSPLTHIIGHITFGLGMGTLFGAAMGCLLLWLLRHIVPAAGGKTHLRTSH